MTYIIQDSEAGNIIEEVKTLAEAEVILEAFESDDKKDWTYTPNFYEIVDTNGNVQ